MSFEHVSRTNRITYGGIARWPRGTLVRAGGREGLDLAVRPAGRR
jgi:hypothetical protein